MRQTRLFLALILTTPLWIIFYILLQFGALGIESITKLTELIAGKENIKIAE